MKESKGTYDVFTVFEDIMASDLDEYQVKQLAMLLIANTLTYETARKTAEVVIERTNEEDWKREPW
tara:strand:+ start:366 stop:563 length:198 start_codon:yes stop_codon:yes gene_type:complete